MAARVAAIAIFLLLSVQGLQLDSIADEEAERPRRHQQGSQPAEPAPTQNSNGPSGRVAVLVSGVVERLLLTPILSNVVRANAQEGLTVDLFLSLYGVPGKAAEANDPKIASAIQRAGASGFDSAVMDHICQLAKENLAADCLWDREGANSGPMPKDEVHLDIMTQQSPFNTTEGKAAIAKWRSLAHLWAKVRAKEEHQDEYAAIVVARDDAYWLAPRTIDIQEFEMDPSQVSAMPCLESTGINDKAVIMGREAAEVLLTSYEAWQKGEPKLRGTRTAEEVWLRLAAEAGLNMKPEPMFAALASYTQSGLPCFQEKTFDQSQRGGFDQCFAESGTAAPVTSLFSAFSCETMNPLFYDLLWPQQVQRLQQTVASLAGNQERSPVLLTVVDKEEVDMASNMLTSLQAAGEQASSLVVGTTAGICKALADSFGVPGSKCMVVQPAQDVRRNVFKHAILTTVALAGLTDRIVYASPRTSFDKPLTSQPAAFGKRILFSRSASAQRDSNPCSEASGDDLSHIDSSAMVLYDAAEAADMLLRTWDLMQDNPALSHQAAMIAALDASSYGGFGLLACGTHKAQDGLLSGKRVADDEVLSAEMPPRAVKPRREDGTEWVNKISDQVSRVTRKAADDGQKRSSWEKQAAWEKQAGVWRDSWQMRIEQMQQENGYNATAVREQRKAERQYRRTHKTKHVRYLPPEEAAKVKAAEQKWEADKEKQKAEDLEKASSRREEFEREVAKAKAIIAGHKPASNEPASIEEDMGAE